MRDVNSKIIVERYPMPNIYEMLSRLESGKVFTKIDLRSAYHGRVKRHYCVHYYRRSFPLYANTLRSCALVICVPMHDAQDIQGGELAIRRRVSYKEEN